MENENIENIADELSGKLTEEENIEKGEGPEQKNPQSGDSQSGEDSQSEDSQSGDSQSEDSQSGGDFSDGFSDGFSIGSSAKPETDIPPTMNPELVKLQKKLAVEPESVEAAEATTVEVVTDMIEKTGVCFEPVLVDYLDTKKIEENFADWADKVTRFTPDTTEEVLLIDFLIRNKELIGF